MGGVKHSGNIAGLPHGLGSLGHFPPGPLSFPAGSALAGEGGQAAGRTWRPRYAGGRGRARRGRAGALAAGSGLGAGTQLSGCQGFIR